MRSSTTIGEPTAAGADDGEVAVDVEGHRLWNLAGQDLLEVTLGQPVLSLQEEGPGEFQAQPDQRGVRHQHLAEGGDRLVEQPVALVTFSQVSRLHALAEQGGKVLGLRGRRKDREHE